MGRRRLQYLLGSVVLIATFAWAVAFSLIYARPITRVAASDWIYQNIPGPINLHIQTGAGIIQPATFDPLWQHHPTRSYRIKPVLLPMPAVP